MPGPNPGKQENISLDTLTISRPTASGDFIDQPATRRQVLGWLSVAALACAGITTVGTQRQSSEPTVGEFRQYRSDLINRLNDPNANFYDTNVKLGHLLSRYKGFVAETGSSDQGLKDAIATYATHVLNCEVGSLAEGNNGILTEDQRRMILSTTSKHAGALALSLSPELQARIDALTSI